MKRDMDLVRAVMMEIEAAEGTVGLADLERGAAPALEPAAPEAARAMLWYHLRLLDWAGYIDAELTESDRGGLRRARVYGLTWDGQDFLDAMRDDGVWERVKEAMRRSVGSTTFEVVKTCCATVAAAMTRAVVAQMFPA